MIIECGSVTGVVVVLTALPLLLLAAIFEIVTVFVGKTELSHFLLLVMPPDQAEERVGDLTEAALVVIEKHGHRYAKFWYMWTGFWIIAATIVSKAPGKRLIDAVIGRISRE